MLRFISPILILFLLCSCGKAERPLYAIHIHGDWCKTCMRIDRVIHNTEKFFRKRANVRYIMFDETNPESIAKSEKLAKKLGLEEIFEYERHTGEFLYVDKKSKEVLTRFYGVDSKDKYILSTEILLKGGEVEDILAEKRNYKLSKPDLVSAQGALLYVVDIHHDMCGGCAITAPVFEEVALDFTDNKDICFMTFDLTNKESNDASKKLAQELGLEEIYKSRKHTGEVLFIDAQKKEIIHKLVLEKDKSKYYGFINHFKDYLS